MAAMLLEHHRQTKQTIIDHLHKLADVADAVGMTTLAQNIRTTRIPKLEKERFYLVVLGEFNHGKSTFVNALLGADVLPTGITPTTAAINHVIWGDTPRMQAVMPNGETMDLGMSALSTWVTAGGSRTREVSYVEVGYPSEILRENITLVDTPGVNDLNESRADITYGYVPRADAVLFLLDAGQALKESEREFLASHVLEGTRDRLVFVLGKMDLLSEAERQAVVEYVRDGLRKLVPQPVVFPLSAKNWLSGKRQDSGMPELLEYLGRFLNTDRAQVLLDNAAGDACRTAAYLEQNLGVKLHAFKLDLAVLEERISNVRAQLNASKRTLDELHTRIDAEAKAIRAQVHLDLDSFTKRFLQALPEEIDKVDADDVKTYLPGFIEAKFRDFAELEGRKLATLLEQLAEEVIAVTNENIEAASAALANRIGPADTQVDIEVDSFKYDVGIYAVGALGTTVFFFVNTLAGGLLTLAAPVLAIVLKSKVAGDIREQAKARVPGAVQNAASAMRPHFDQCIDDFAGRLGEFVSSAGNTLYKGISEILDRTVQERRARGSEVEPLKAATADQIQMVAEARKTLTTIRELLWQNSAPPRPEADRINAVFEEDKRAGDLEELGGDSDGGHSDEGGEPVADGGDGQGAGE